MKVPLSSSKNNKDFRQKLKEKIKTYFMSNNFFSKNHAVYEIMWKNMVEPDRPQVAIRYGTCIWHAG